jgi:predicted O-methyltransferase YrrM
LDRLAMLAEIQANKRFVRGGYRGSAPTASAYDDFVSSLKHFDAQLAELLSAGGMGERAFTAVQEYFDDQSRAVGALRLPTYFNADRSLASICYALVRHLKPKVIIETGVGYGFTTAVMLRAVEENGVGRVVSIDLPALADPLGEQAGLAIAPELRDRWSYRSGTSRRLLRKVLAEVGQCDLFVSDSANVATLQRFEWRTIGARLTPGGAAVFNNVAGAFSRELRQSPDATVWIVRQVQKLRQATALTIVS